MSFFHTFFATEVEFVIIDPMSFLVFLFVAQSVVDVSNHAAIRRMAHNPVRVVFFVYFSGFHFISSFSWASALKLLGGFGIYNFLLFFLVGISEWIRSVGDM